MPKRHFGILGHKVRDVVSGFEGIASSVCFDLYGCVQVVVAPTIDRTKPSDFPDGRYFDIKRLIKKSRKPVMAVPDFSKPEIGASDKPPSRTPRHA
jgi:hypothetical protein